MTDATVTTAEDDRPDDDASREPAASVASTAAQPSTSSGAPSPGAACTDHYSKSVGKQEWWDAHFTDAADAVIDFLGGDGISLTGRSVADIGCGDGIIDLAVAVKAEPARLVGFDLLDTDVAELAERARRHGGIDALPDSLYFATSGAASLPAEDDTFDFVISWSAFEHILDVDGMLTEIHRVMKPTGVLFIQLWPFYDSAHGSHLVDWFPEGFAQNNHSDEEIIRIVRSSGDQEMAAEMLGIYQTLNRITADELGDALRRNHFRVAKLSLDTGAVHIPQTAADIPLSQVGITGITLLAVPLPVPPPEPEPERQPEPVPEPEPAANAATALRGLLRRADAALARFDPRH